jgi:hypothetical protein
MVSNSFLVETYFVTKPNQEAWRERKLKLFKKQENWFLRKQWSNLYKLRSQIQKISTLSKDFQRIWKTSKLGTKYAEKN